MFWTIELTEILLRELKKYECLYASYHPDYSNNYKKDLAINKIAKVLKEYNQNVDGNEVKSKIELLQEEIRQKKTAGMNYYEWNEYTKCEDSLWWVLFFNTNTRNLIESNIGFVKDLNVEANVGNVEISRDSNVENSGYARELNMGNAQFMSQPNIENSGYLRDPNVGNVEFMPQSNERNAGILPQTNFGSTEFITESDILSAELVTEAFLGVARCLNDADPVSSNIS